MTHYLTGYVPADNDEWTNKCLDGLLGQTPALTDTLGDWTTPLGRGTVTDAWRRRDGGLNLTLQLPRPATRLWPTTLPLAERDSSGRPRIGIGYITRQSSRFGSGGRKLRAIDLCDVSILRPGPGYETEPEPERIAHMVVGHHGVGTPVAAACGARFTLTRVGDVGDRDACLPCLTLAMDAASDAYDRLAKIADTYRAPGADKTLFGVDA